jgi:replicative DNA helicase
MFDRLPPYSLESEMSLLGSMILDWRVIGDVLQIIRGAGDFYKPAHGAIYQVMVDLYDEQTGIDNVQIIERLRGAGLLEKVGGTDYVVGLAEAVPVAMHAPHYARIVRNKAQLRGLIQAAGEILRAAYETTDDIAAVCDAAESSIFKAVDGDGAVNNAQSLAEQLDVMIQKLETEEGPHRLGMRSGMRKLDDILGGLHAGEMIVVAARPSMGKTAVAVQMAMNIAAPHGFENGQPVLFHSLEMSRQQIAERMLINEALVDSQRFRRNMLDERSRDNLKRAAETLSKAPILVDDTPGLSITQFRASVRRAYQRHGIRCAIVDYLQLMSGQGESRQEEVAEISRGVKAIARELDIPVLALCQLNRKSEETASKRPTLSNLRESGAIEQDADVVILLHREDYYHLADENYTQSHRMELIVAKQRNGPQGVVEMHYEASTGRIIDVAGPTLGE